MCYTNIDKLYAVQLWTLGIRFSEIQLVRYSCNAHQHDTHLDILLAETQMVEIPLMESIVKCLRCAVIGDTNTIQERYTNSFGTTCSFLVNLFCSISGI